MKMILTDLDHTLLKEDGSISDETLRILARCRAKGLLLAIATARYRIGAERYIRQLDPDYEITTDGTLIHARGRCVYSHAFSAAETDRIIRCISAAVPGAEITVACGETVYWNSPDIRSSERLHKAVYCDYSSPLPSGGNKIAALLPDGRIAERIAEETESRLQCYRGENLYAFLPQGSGKTAAVRALSDISGVRLEDIVAFGDDANDTGMLKMCGKGVAVANSVPEILEIADDITLSNDMDGVALWLNCHCLYQSLLSAAYNTRDLGGYPAPPGRMTVRNRVWRSGALTAWEPSDAETLKARHITTLIDLRTDEEVQRRPCAYSCAAGFDYRRIPIVTGSEPPDTLAEVPVSYMRIALQKETADILRTIAEADSGVLFFCTAGKDRTGVISALLLLACGVDHKTIIGDYVLSREYNRIRLEIFLSEHPEVDRQIVLANEISMERFIRLFLDRFGTVGAFFEQAGLSPAHLTRIRAKLTDAP